MNAQYVLPQQRGFSRFAGPERFGTCRCNKYGTVTRLRQTLVSIPQQSRVTVALFGLVWSRALPVPLGISGSAVVAVEVPAPPRLVFFAGAR
jgi:hypothetical protein